MKIQYRFSSVIRKYNGAAGWYFISLPEKLSKEIRKTFRTQEEGWGRLKATACIGSSEWQTAIWFDTKLNTYLLPLKAEIRKKENLKADEKAEVALFI